MNIEEASNRNIFEIVKMCEILHNQHGWNGKFNKKWKIKHLKEILTNPKFIVLVAIIEKQTIGYCIGKLDKEEAIQEYRCIILEIFVKEKFRNLGIGYKLAKTTIDWGINNNAFEILANVAIDNIFGGKELCEKLGFIERSIRYVKNIRQI